MRTQLLCTFTKRNRFYETIDIILACNDIVFDKVYVFQNENDYHQLICTYNVEYDEDAIQGGWMSFDNDGAHQVDVQFDVDGALAFKENFGNNGISSPFQDGGYIYLVIPGSGSGTTAKAPALLVADIENPIQMHKTLTP